MGVVDPDVTVSTDELFIGRGLLVSDYYFSGRIAEVALWSTILTVGEMEALAAGTSPLSIRPSNLAFYAPLIGNTTDVISGQTLSASGSPTADPDHPPVMRPSNQHTPVPAKGKIWINDTPSLTGAKQVTHPGNANWSNTSITIQENLDLSGFSGQLYLGIERYTGEIDWDPLDAFGVSSVSTDDDIPDDEAPWVIDGYGFGER